MQRLLAVAIAGLIFSGLAHAECPDADRKALEAFDRAWGQANHDGDKAALEKIMADDYRDLAVGNGLDRATTIANAMEDFEHNRAHPEDAPKLAYDHYVIHCTPNGATITHRVVASGTENGKAWTDWRRSVHVLEKRGGTWQVVSNAGHGLDDSEHLLYLERDWSVADVNRDVPWYERNFADDFSGVSSRTGSLFTKAENIADVKAGKIKTTWSDISELDARVDGDTAVVTGIEHAKGTDDKGQAFDRRVRFTDTYIKRDGEWQVLASQGTLIADK